MAPRLMPSLFSGLSKSSGDRDGLPPGSYSNDMSVDRVVKVLESSRCSSRCHLGDLMAEDPEDTDDLNKSTEPKDKMILS